MNNINFFSILKFEVIDTLALINVSVMIKVKEYLFICGDRL